jgi:hypothetical protein
MVEKKREGAEEPSAEEKRSSHPILTRGTLILQFGYVVGLLCDWISYLTSCVEQVSSWAKTTDFSFKCPFCTGVGLEKNNARQFPLQPIKE